MAANALLFDGVNDAVNLGVPTWAYSTQFRSTMTIECWFRTSDTNNQKLGGFVSRWISGGYASHSMFLLAMNPDGSITCWITNESGVFGSTQTTTTYKDTLWHHVAVTYNSSTGVLSMYIDGVFTNNSTNSSFGLLSSSTLMRLIFGNDDAGTTPGTQTDRQFRGSLADIRVWNVVRSAADISANFRQRLVGNETGLIGYWKLHQGYGTGWGSYTTASDSTANRAHGTLINFASPASNWVLSTLNFRPRISAITLGPKNGTYSLFDASFSFIDPSSNSLGTFSYAIDASNAGITASVNENGAATTKMVYSSTTAHGATITVPTLNTYEFPEIASLMDWQIDISFTVTGGAGTWRAIVGDMYNEINTRGWGIWVSSSNRIQWSWANTTSEPATISVELNTAYRLTVAQSSSPSSLITITLLTIATSATQTGSFSTGGNPIGKGPVTIGGWRTTSSENFPGTISFVNVTVPTNQRVVTLISSTAAGMPATITATQGTFNDFTTNTATAALTITQTATVFSTTFTVPAKYTSSAPFALTPPTSNNPTGAFSYTSSNLSVATIGVGANSNIVTLIGRGAPGTSTITVTQAATATHTANTATATLIVTYDPNQISADLSGVNLSGINFTNYDFTNADLTNANLTNAVITNANLTNTRIVGANLTGVTFADGQKIQLRQNADNIAANIAAIALPATIPPTCSVTSRMASGGTVRTVNGFTGSPGFSDTTKATRSMTLSAFGVSVGSGGSVGDTGTGRCSGTGSGGSGTTVGGGGTLLLAVVIFAVSASF